MGVIKTIAAAVGIGESPAEKARKKAKRAEQAATEKRAKVVAEQKAKAAGVVTKRKEDAQAAEAGKGAAASKLALISTSSQGVLDQASTGRRKLFGN